MPLRAALFDVGDTLVEHWATPAHLQELLRVALRREFGERAWYERWVSAKLGPRAATFSLTAGSAAPEDDSLRQETLRWYADWFRDAQIGIDDIPLERLRSTMCVPLDLVSRPVPGAFAALRWCRARGLAVVLVSNTLSRGEAEVWTDWRRFGVADAIDAVVTSHGVGWQKPHPRMFERALELARARPEEAFMVGDRLDADVFGASRLGLRTVWRRTAEAQADRGVRPDAIVDDLTQLPAVVEPWLGAPSAQSGFA